MTVADAGVPPAIEDDTAAVAEVVAAASNAASTVACPTPTPTAAPVAGAAATATTAACALPVDDDSDTDAGGADVAELLLLLQGGALGDARTTEDARCPDLPGPATHMPALADATQAHSQQHAAPLLLSDADAATAPAAAPVDSTSDSTQQASPPTQHFPPVPPASRRAPRLEPPSDLCCPITTELLDDPVFAADGYLYSRTAIAAWLQKSCTSPMTGEALLSTVITPCPPVHSMVRAWRELHGVAPP